MCVKSLDLPQLPMEQCLKLLLASYFSTQNCNCKSVMVSISQISPSVMSFSPKSIFRWLCLICTLKAKEHEHGIDSSGEGPLPKEGKGLVIFTSCHILHSKQQAARTQIPHLLIQPQRVRIIILKQMCVHAHQNATKKQKLHSYINPVNFIIRT